MFLRIVAAAVLCLTPATHAVAKPSLQPTGKWIIHFDDAQCVAERNYGSERSPLQLVLKQPPIGSAMQLAVIQKGNSGFATQVDGRLEFDGHEARKVSVLRFSPQGTKTRVQLMNLPLELFSPARTATALRIRGASGFDEQFALYQVGPLLELMDKCVADLRRIWNVDGPDPSQNTVREDAKGKLGALFSSEDYPWQSVVMGEGGSVKIALLVNEQGKVADCSVMETSGVAMLDAQSCAVVRERARFTPAIGKDGKPAKDAFIQRITWRTR